MSSPVSHDYNPNILGYGEQEIISQGIDNELVIKGKVFSLRASFDLAASGSPGDVKYMLLELPDPGVTEDILGFPFILKTSSGLANLFIRKNEAISTKANNGLFAFNRKGIIFAATEQQAKLYDTLTFPGIAPEDGPLKYTIGVKSTNQTSGGELQAGERNFILCPGDTFLFIMKNLENSTNEFDIRLDWAERYTEKG